MATPRHLDKPPIVEAVLDFQVTFAEARPPEHFDKMWDRIRRDYPKQETRHNVEVEFQIGPGTATPTSALHGFVYRSEDGGTVIQAKTDGFAFSKLNPYKNWEEVLKAGWPMWQLYCELFGPNRVRRIATRFINRLVLPGQSVGKDFDNYLTIGPRTPSGVPPFVSTFATIVTIPNPSLGTMTILQLKYDGQHGPNGIGTPVLIDIDVLKECDIDPADDGQLREVIAVLRDVKNATFFGSVHDAALEGL